MIRPEKPTERTSLVQRSRRDCATRATIVARDDRSFIATGDGVFPLALDHESLKPENLDTEVVALFDVDAARGDSLIAFGWAMAEQLAKLS